MIEYCAFVNGSDIAIFSKPRYSATGEINRTGMLTAGTKS